MLIALSAPTLKAEPLALIDAETFASVAVWALAQEAEKAAENDAALLDLAHEVAQVLNALDALLALDPEALIASIGEDEASAITGFASQMAEGVMGVLDSAPGLADMLATGVPAGGFAAAQEKGGGENYLGPVPLHDGGSDSEPSASDQENGFLDTLGENLADASQAAGKWLVDNVDQETLYEMDPSTETELPVEEAYETDPFLTPEEDARVGEGQSKPTDPAPTTDTPDKSPSEGDINPDTGKPYTKEELDYDTFGDLDHDKTKDNQKIFLQTDPEGDAEVIIHPNDPDNPDATTEILVDVEVRPADEEPSGEEPAEGEPAGEEPAPAEEETPPPPAEEDEDDPEPEESDDEIPPDPNVDGTGGATPEDLPEDDPTEGTTQPDVTADDGSSGVPEDAEPGLAPLILTDPDADVIVFLPIPDTLGALTQPDVVGQHEGETPVPQPQKGTDFLLEVAVAPEVADVDSF
ncbi:MAG: hypothetical protein AAF526_09550, partial [Pseudomonadota bacterium]